MIRLIRPECNLGFAGGAKAGVAAGRAPLILILNSDVVSEPGALDQLLERFATQPDAAGLVPLLEGTDGRPQTTWQLRKFPTAIQCFLQALLAPQPKGLEKEPPVGTPIEQPAPAALALRPSAFGLRPSRR